ncbi:hypothetical protein P153DRAFT_33687 [Dothidotthia symphoricarpi CBS 119687]|uniref:Uncharacterized protein n=1 Tax=Dothidotthia symphoricarpi CBS 119687 TaxID=1392245 RepID=A0A6A6ADY6_9PLEO|nr:uncharacterized protein P153DRAFT_33687 [Dothidotthia symphoricarpi CBS 119687]KAF2129168.1 hypothetical protein P153DRAFT_33687 [Dothidotthia symphoricarpi CBS 119687]
MQHVRDHVSRSTRKCSRDAGATRERVHDSLSTIKLLKRFRKCSGTVPFLSNNTCVKYGRSMHLSEACIIRFIAERLTGTTMSVHALCVLSMSPVAKLLPSLY